MNLVGSDNRELSCLVDVSLRSDTDFHCPVGYDQHRRGIMGVRYEFPIIPRMKQHHVRRIRSAPTPAIRPKIAHCLGRSSVPVIGRCISSPPVTVSVLSEYSCTELRCGS